MRPAHETAQLQLARLALDVGAERYRLLEEVGRIGARTLRVERVSLWFFTRDRRHLHCEMVYDGVADVVGTWDGVPTIRTDECPSYVTALETRRTIATEDARTDVATRELTSIYLDPLGIEALLDAPLYVGGEVVGVICHEQVRRVRRWAQADVDFATSVADMACLALAQMEWHTWHDLVDRRAARLREMDRLQALEHVVRAFVHDFNNVLSVVTLSSATLHDGREPSAEVLETLDEGAAMATRLVTNLRAFVNRERSAARSRPLGALLGCMAPVLGIVVRDRATLTVTVAPEVAAVAVPQDTVEQALLNLCLNARDAIEAEGHIDIRATAAPGGRVQIEVEDDGAGIAAETLVKVFAPYFTTKAHGTGLGLATSRELIEESGGQLTVRSEVGRGTTFTMSFPANAPPR
jgi:two-component system, cell cycle sensor histidine kinase and response regulator CckA